MVSSLLYYWHYLRIPMHEEDSKFCNRPILTLMPSQWPFFNIANKSNISSNCGSLNRVKHIITVNFRLTGRQFMLWLNNTFHFTNIRFTASYVNNECCYFSKSFPICFVTLIIRWFSIIPVFRQFRWYLFLFKLL